MADAAPAAARPGADDDLPLRRPASCGEVFRVFNRLALQGFGGVLPVAHRELVERERWLSPGQFVELLTLGQVLPGPNIVNLALIVGDRHFGWRGALAACGGLLLVPLFIVLALATLYTRYAALPEVAGALRGMGAVAAGLVVATAVKLSLKLKTNPLGRPAALALAAATAATVGVLRWPMVWVVLALGALGMALAWRRIRAQDALRAAR
jgi:chromate transporter